MKDTKDIIESSYFKKVLELIKSVLPVIIYPNEPESLAVKITKLHLESQIKEKPIRTAEESSTNSNIGSYHWFHTLIAKHKDIGEFLRENMPEESLVKLWGENLYNTSKELIAGYEYINKQVETKEEPKELREELSRFYIHLVAKGKFIETNPFDAYKDADEYLTNVKK